MWRLFAASTSHVIGVERYGHRVFSPTGLTPELFSEERFYSIEDGDTFYDNLESFNDYYRTAKARHGTATFWGDKIPKLYNYFPTIEANFSDAEIIFLFRNIVSVAASYKVRAENPDDLTWGPDRGVSKAISEWTQSIASYKHWRSKLRIRPICFETFFFRKAALSSLDGLLDISDPVIQQRHARLIARATTLEQSRTNILTSQELRHICCNAPFGSYREIINESDSRYP